MGYVSRIQGVCGSTPPDSIRLTYGVLTGRLRTSSAISKIWQKSRSRSLVSSTRAQSRIHTSCTVARGIVVDFPFRFVVPYAGAWRRRQPRLAQQDAFSEWDLQDQLRRLPRPHKRGAVCLWQARSRTPVIRTRCRRQSESGVRLGRC